MIKAGLTKQRRLKLAASGIAWVTLTAAQTPTIDGIQQWQQRVERVQDIAHRILAANVAAGPVKRNDLGMITASPNPSASAAVRAAWYDALHLKDASTVLTVFSAGPAEQAGIQVGDAIVAAQGIRWADSRQNFAQAMQQGERAGQITLTVKHGALERDIALTAQIICQANVILIDNKRANAWANGSGIVIEGGLERLLSDDAEMAFVIAHEAAHILLGHSAASTKTAQTKTVQRKDMELEADRLGVRLAARAGYAPEAGARAHPKIANANRGPIAKLLDLHGPYLSTTERAAFLADQAKEAHAESLAP